MDAPTAHPGSHLLGQQVTFQLKWSDQATTFNTDRHDEFLLGEVKLAYDGFVNITVEGWRFGHRVRAEHVAPATGGSPTVDRAIAGDPPSWLIRLVCAADTFAQDTACVEGPEHEEGCDRCAWEALYEAVPHTVIAAISRAEMRQA